MLTSGKYEKDSWKDTYRYFSSPYVPLRWTLRSSVWLHVVVLEKRALKLLYTISKIFQCLCTLFWKVLKKGAVTTSTRAFQIFANLSSNDAFLFVVLAGFWQSFRYT